jgi:DNA transformation protein
MPVSDSYLGLIRDLLSWLPDLRTKRMFGGIGLYSGDHFFAIVMDNVLYLKADENNRQLFQDGGGEIFSYLRQGKPCALNYWSVPEDIFEEPDVLRTWVGTALEASLRAKD